MAPVCSSYFDSNPQGNHIQYFHPCPPLWGAMPPTVKVEQSEPPLTYIPWSSGSCYGYHPSPWECRSCCHHSHPSGYYSFRPPYAHFPQPPLGCYHGPYPPYTEACPPYNIPVPHYRAKQPRYEYDKNTSGNLCSRCLNKCNQRDASGVKIEEHEPEIDKKENDALAPLKFKNNHPFPIMWIPAEFMKNKDSSKAKESSKQPESEPNLWNGRLPYSMKNNKESNEPSNTEQESWNGWLPLDLNSMKSLMQGVDAKGGDQDNKGDKKEQLPFPILWIPASGKPEGALKKDQEVITNSPKIAEELPAISKLIPMKHPENDESGNKKVVERSNSSPKEKVAKDIPVKENEQNGAKEMSDDSPRKGTQVMQPVEIIENKSLDNNVKRKSPSPPKESKVPPICLRVDPMPRRKNGNGTSRSPSPPGHKFKVQEDSNGTSKTSSAQAEKNEPRLESKQHTHLQEKPVVHTRKDIAVTEVEDVNVQKVVVDTKNQAGAPQEVLGDAGVSRPETPEMVIDGDKGATAMTKEKPGQDKKGKKNLSAAAAAILIQSAYRGYEVRRWEPLKKLKPITKVGEQVHEVRKRIQDPESSVEEEKQRVAIGETIMNLLLQLDTIQGLHPSLRDARKSVARELISLQEKLDSLTSRNMPGEAGVQSLNDTAHNNKREVIHSIEEPKEVKHDHNLFEHSGCCQSHEDKSCNGPTEPEHQLGTSSSIIGNACASDKEEHVNLANTSIESHSVYAKAVGPEAVDGPCTSPSANLKDEGPNISFEVQNTNELPEERANYSSVIEQKADLGAEEGTGLSGVKVCPLEGESNFIAELLESGSGADDIQLMNIKDEKLDNCCSEPKTTHIEREGWPDKAADMNSVAGHVLEKTRNENEEFKPVLKEQSPVESWTGELTGSSSECRGFQSGVRSESEVAEHSEPVALPSEDDVEKAAQLGVEKEEKFDETLELQVEEKAHSVLEVQWNDPNPGETTVQQLTEGENNEVIAEIFKEEQLEKAGLLEKSVEAHGSFSSEDSGSAVVSQDDIAGTFEKNGEDKAIVVAETKTSEIGQPTFGETRDNSSQFVGLEPLDDASHGEENERKVLDSDANEDTIVEQESENSSPSRVEQTEEMVYEASSAANLKDAPLSNHERIMAKEKKLVEENEKLREMLEKLMEAGKQQINAISELHGKVRDLERKMSRKKKMKVKQRRDMCKREAVSCAM